MLENFDPYSSKHSKENNQQKSLYRILDEIEIRNFMHFH